MPQPTLRQRQAEEVRTATLEAAMRVMERAEEPTMRGIAAEAGISERTIYRYFNNLEALFLALTPTFMQRSTVALPAAAEDLPEYAHQLFTVFEENTALIVALTQAQWMQSDLAQSRAKNLADLRQILDTGFPQAAADELESAAATLRVVLSGAGWVYQRVSCSIPNDQVIQNAVWLISAIFDQLAGNRSKSANSSKGQRRRRQ